MKQLLAFFVLTALIVLSMYFVGGFHERHKQPRKSEWKGGKGIRFWRRNWRRRVKI